MDIKLLASILLGKIIFFLSQYLKIGGGSAAPGLYALKVDPELITKLSARIPKTVIVTGTNGKTTTAKLLAHFAEKQGLKVIRNATGSNLERGIASSLITHYQVLSTKNQVNLGIWEVDEAAFNSVALKTSPDIIIFLNAFRDQLDRYGEVDSIIKKWSQTLEKISSKTTILVNGDDQNLYQLKASFHGQTKFFGLKNYKIKGEKVIKQAENEKLDFEAINIKTKGVTESSFEINKQSIDLPLAGVFNIYNFLASFATASLLNFDQQKTIDSLKDFSPAFGRMEKIDLKGREGYIFLIKNPVGATQILQTITGDLKDNDRLLIALNDNFADGKDVSWIWDVGFEKFMIHNSRFKITCSGIRADDLALRLKYAGYDTKELNVETDLNTAFQEAQKGLSGRLFVLLTYTCLLELQKILVNKGLKKEYWQEQ